MNSDYRLVKHKWVYASFYGFFHQIPSWYFKGLLLINIWRAVGHVTTTIVICSLCFQPLVNVTGKNGCQSANGNVDFDGKSNSASHDGPLLLENIEIHGSSNDL